ncbi:MAG: GxxExxY protein [Lentisphaeraceae bacterium]|nr:GxxExxY protein [Lentisphaeraceae bacterium]
MLINEITGQIVDACYQIHTDLGPGLLESVYEICLYHELISRGFKVKRQVPVKIEYKGITFDKGFIADLIINDTVILELKSVKEICDIDKKQLLTYLKLTDKSVGLLINFNTKLMKEGITRIINGYFPKNTN